MNKELELWKFIGSCLGRGQSVMLLVVAQSSGSSPGRPGYKMAVGEDGELCGSIGGGVMEVNLVEQCRASLAITPQTNPSATLSMQTHRKNASNPSGMICSGEQTVILKQLEKSDFDTVSRITAALENDVRDILLITHERFAIVPATKGEDISFKKLSETEFEFRESIGEKNDLYIIGGGHCALALSELTSRLDFRISIFDDRPQLNTIAKNNFADRITIIESYENVAEHIPSGANVYVVVMTLGFKSDETVIRSLFDKTFRYFGVLGSKAKMRTLLSALEKEGFSKERLTQIRTPIGIPINSHTPEEIAVSIAAEIIAVKNQP